MFAYPRYQTQQPMYAYNPEEYYYQSGSESSYHQPHYEESNQANRYSKRRSSTKKPRRSKSFSKMEYNSNYNDHHQRNHGDEEYYYQGRHRLDGVRSVSPFTENRGYHHARMQQDNEDIAAGRRQMNSWAQPTSFVNLGQQPMINPMTNNFQMQQSLGACATDTWPGMTTNAYIPPHNELFYPQQNVPMIQPYYMPPPPLASNPFLSAAVPTSYYPQQQAALFPNLMHMPMLFPEFFSNNTTVNNEVKEEENTASKEVTPTASQKTSPTINTNQIPDAVTNTAAAAARGGGGGPVKRPVVLHRKKSFMEGILSSFSLLGDDVNYAPAGNSTLHGKPDDGTATDNLKSTTWDPTSYTSLSEALNTDSVTSHPPAEGGGEKKVSSLSRKTSTRLLQKANALQTRQYIWCYRPYKQSSQASPDGGDDSKESSPGLWAAFDMQNQFKLDSQHYFLMSMKSRGILQPNGGADAKYHRPDIVTDDPHHILVLNKQSNISSPVMVSVNDSVAWYNNPMKADFDVLEIACMPTHHNRLVVSNELIQQEEEAAATKPLRRSKSIDGLASKLLNTVLGW
ncbi:hypothetical protein HPULCUR_009911 [Helicostylum pulchrum]|uniref:Uncharacterized protein n=1 Tax=Helicostylum pulchrum TaxID=562976 RepID=A0ABP9YBT0_9FUNG